MKKGLIIALSALLIAGGAFSLCACGGGADDGTPPPGTEQPGPGSENPQLKDFTGLSLTGASHVYDGQTHPLSVAGQLPQGATVDYSANNSSTDAGEYDVTATVKCTGYNNLTLNAKLTITKATMTGLTFKNATYSYDGNAHAIELVGQTPQGSHITYSCKENDALKNSATETGTYTVTVTVTNKNYETFTAQATLKITASEKERFISSYGGKLYFGNALDGDKLYSYTAADGVKKVSGDIPYNFTVSGGDLYFRSYTPFASSVKTVGENGTNAVISAKGEYLCSDGNNLYYSVNALTNAKSGIYKVNLAGEEPSATLLSQGKAKYLTYCGDKLYFADGNNGDKLSSIALSGGTRSVVVDEKITCLTSGDGALFYTVDNLAGNYIEKYNVSSSSRLKLTSDAGANLTLIGSRLYYINVDLLNSYLFGKGIFSVNASPAAENNLPGTKVIGADDESYSSLTSTADGKLAYYRVSDQMLCVSNTDGGDTVEVLQGFVAPETVPISTGSKTLAYGKTLYFLDLYNDKALYAYDTTSAAISRVTSNKVSDFAILGDTLYYNAVSFGVNNDLYKIDLKLGGEAEKISSNDCNDIVTDGHKIFYIKENAAGAATAITEIAEDGTETDIFTKGVSNLVYYDGYLYFEYENKVHRMSANGYTVDDAENVTHKDVSHVGTFVIDNDVIYFRELYGLGWGFKRLSKMNTDGTGYSVIITENTDPLEIQVAGDYIYYYNDVAKGVSGLYRISKNGGEAQLILDGQSKYYASKFTIIDGKIYFINFRAQLGDSHLYSVDITNGTVEKIV